MFEYEESKKAELRSELKKGVKSGFVKDFDPDSFLKDLHKKHLSDEIQETKKSLDNKTFASKHGY